jgi:hypothetical protein
MMLSERKANEKCKELQQMIKDALEKLKAQREKEKNEPLPPIGDIQ